jgi:cell wall assembly regulator SMI1
MNIAESVQAIKDWTKKHAPPLHKIIGKPATEADLKKLRKSIGFDLPADYLEWLLLMNGQTDCRKDDSLGLIPGDAVYFLFSAKMVEEQFEDNEDDARQKKKVTADAAIQPVFFDAKWIRIAMDGDTEIAIDMNPTEHGTMGQVILIEYGPNPRRLLYGSFTEFLSGLAKAYQNHEVEWDGEVLTRKKNCSFPLLDLKARAKEKLLVPSGKTTTGKSATKTSGAKAVVNKKASSAIALPKPSFRVVVRGRTEVTKGDKVIGSSATLKALSGQIYADESIQDYFGSSKHEKSVSKKIVSGGNIELQFDPKLKLLFVVSTFELLSRPTEQELKTLVENTTGQWSDGFGGELSASVEENKGLFVDVFPFLDDYDASKPEVTVESL